MNLRHVFSGAVRQAATDFGVTGSDPAAIQVRLEVTQSDRPDLADYQSNAAMILAKVLKKAPREIASAFQNNLSHRLDGIAEVSVAGPGFINLRVNDEWLARQALGQIKESANLIPEASKKVVIDFGGPNIAKELHIGHLRPHLIGDSLQHIMRYAGDQVISDIHLGDWGTPLGMIIAQLKLEQPELPFFTPKHTSYPAVSPVNVEQLGELYRRSKRSWDESPEFQKQARTITEMLQSGAHQGYRALWQQLRNVSIDDLKRIYTKLGVEYDLWLGESDVQDLLQPMVQDLQQRNIATVSDGAIVIAADKLTLGDGPPLILQKSDGGFTYAATDLATIKERVELRNAEVILYVVDNRQKQHFEQVFAAARLSGYAPPEVQLEHIGHGTINGPDGRPFKTRDGNTVKLSDILDLASQKAVDELPLPGEQGMTNISLAQLSDQIGIAAVKFHELRNSRRTDYIFNVEEFTRFEGKTGPYLQYAMARTASILKKIEEEPLASSVKITLPCERDLLLHLWRLPEAIETAYVTREPNVVAEHAYGLVQRFGTFYAQAPVIQEPDASVRASRLTLVRAVSDQLRTVMGLLNIQAPQHMLRRLHEPAPG